MAAIHSLFATAGPQALLNARIVRQEAALNATRPPLSRTAAILRGAWVKEGKGVAREYVELVSRWDRGWSALPDFHYPSRELLHVYGADVTGAGGDFVYALEWTHLDPFAGTGSFAQANRRSGLIGAAHYTTSGCLHSYGGVGVRVVPKTGIGRFSVRPYVN